MKQRFLIKCWFPHRGSSKSNPAYYKGNSNNLFYDLDHDINVDHCYTSLARAQRAAGRLGPYTWFTIIEVPQAILVNNHDLAIRIVKAGRFTDAIRAISPDVKRDLCPYWKYWGQDSEVSFLVPFLNRYLDVTGKAFSL